MAISNPRGFVIQTLWSPNRSRQIPWIKKRCSWRTTPEMGSRWQAWGA